MLVDDSPKIVFSCWLTYICSLMLISCPIVLYLLFIRLLVIFVFLMVVVDLTGVGGALLLSKWNQDSKLASALKKGSHKETFEKNCM